MIFINDLLRFVAFKSVMKKGKNAGVQVVGIRVNMAITWAFVMKLLLVVLFKLHMIMSFLLLFTIQIQTNQTMYQIQSLLVFNYI